MRLGALVTHGQTLKPALEMVGRGELASHSGQGGKKIRLVFLRETEHHATLQFGPAQVEGRSHTAVSVDDGVGAIAQRHDRHLQDSELVDARQKFAERGAGL